ncbi:MAG: hypothetical protein J2P36_20640 [Ktedonobacteraceae bacterium]|nr:hypothetical protein [Ktedonobacteraceae bacterium]
MLQDQIKHLSGDAARLLLALLTCNGTETLADLPALIERAGLAQPERNTHGKNRYARAYQQLTDRGLITYRKGTILVQLEVKLQEDTKPLAALQ